MFPSEAKVYKELPKSRTSYESEELVYFLKKSYIPDFVVKTKTGKIYLEVKGFLRSEDQRKMRAVKENNPDLDIRMVFQRDSKVQGSKMLNSQWCAKYGFKFCIGEVPKEWFK